MNSLEIAIIVIVCAAFVAAVTVTVIRKVKHKGCCDECSSCGNACAHRKPAEKNDETAGTPKCDGRCEHCTQAHEDTAAK